MPRIAYTPKVFSRAHRSIIDSANQIIDEYQQQGFDLTLRQLYYQFVARDLLPNQQKEYKRLGNVVNDARLAGELDWDAIVDRTRSLRRRDSWEDPSEIVKTCVYAYHVDMWKGQVYRPEVWIEKDALVGVIAGACQDLDVPYFSCRGYTSQSEMWSAARRLGKYHSQAQLPVVIHLGDHDPSGIDMSRDIEERLTMFLKHHFYAAPVFRRVALNRDQIKKYRPPPNPAKLTDARAAAYVKQHGKNSWELDVLNPTTLDALIRREVGRLIDKKAWRVQEKLKKKGREQLAMAAAHWGTITAALPSPKRKKGRAP